MRRTEFRPRGGGRVYNGAIRDRQNGNPGYNVPPLRAKEWPYVDVLVEALNNVIRLGLGWFATVVTHVPPVSLLVAYWSVGAFFMATKRLAEYRHIGDAAVAGHYRRSFRFYTEDRLLVSLLLYGVVSALFGGIFIVRYHLELILFAPIGLGLLAFYLHLGLRPDSPAQRPEHLYRERAFACYAAACVIVFVVLMFTSIPFPLRVAQFRAGRRRAALDRWTARRLGPGYSIG